MYLDRWGVGHERIGRVFVHRMAAPDPGVDLHDHPWWFVSLVLWGGYVEQRADTRHAPTLAHLAEALGGNRTRGTVRYRRPWTVRTMRLDECHTITELLRPTCWTLVVGGPRRRSWGFYLPSGYMVEHDYDATVRADRRDLWSEQNIGARPW